MTDLDAIRERHHAMQTTAGWVCARCGQTWGEKGCDAAQALARVAELKAALEAISGTDVSDEGEPARPEPKPSHGITDPSAPIGHQCGDAGCPWHGVAVLARPEPKR